MRAGRGLLVDAAVARDATPGLGIRLGENGRVPGHQLLGASGSGLGTKVLYDDQVFRTPATPVYDRVTTPVSNLNVNTETTMYAKSIAAGDLSTNKMLRLTLIGDMIANSVGNAKNLTVRVKYGATTMYAETINFATDSATRSPFRMVFELMNLGATNSQIVVGRYNLSTAGGGTGPTTGEGGTTTANSVRELYGTAAEDSTAAKTLAVTMQWDLTNSTREVKVYAALLELL